MILIFYSKKNKLQKQKERLETELYDVQARCDEQVDSLNDYETSVKSLKNKLRSLSKKLKDKDKLLEDNKKSLWYYTEKYINEEKGKDDKKEIGSVTRKSQMVDVTELEMKLIESQHKLQRLDFYEKNNIQLLDQMAERDSNFKSEIEKYEAELKEHDFTRKQDIANAVSQLEIKLRKEKNEIQSYLEGQLRDDKIKNDKYIKELREDYQALFDERIQGWKAKANDYENKIKQLQNMINQQDD